MCWFYLEYTMKTLEFCLRKRISDKVVGLSWLYFSVNVFPAIEKKCSEGMECAGIERYWWAGCARKGKGVEWVFHQAIKQFFQKIINQED